MHVRFGSVNLSFRHQVGLAAFGLLLVGLGALVTYVARSQHVLVEDSAKADYLNYARGLAIMAADHIRAGEKESIAEHIEMAVRGAEGEVLYIQVEDGEGRPLATAGSPFPSRGIVRAERTSEVGAPPETFFHGEGHVFEIAVPVHHGKDLIGAVRMGISTRRMNQEAFSIMRTASVPMAIGLLVFAGLALFVDSRLRGILRRFIDATHRMAGGDLEHPVVIRTGDDLEELARDFNRMAEVLRERETELRRAKETLEDAVQVRTRELSAEKGRLDAIVGAVGAGMLLVDPGMRVLWANRVAEEWFGPRDRLIGSVWSLAAPVDGASSDLGPVRVAAGSGSTEIADAVPMDVEGRKRWFTVVSSPIRGADGRVTEILELLLDVTRRKEVEEELIQAGKLASVGELAGGVAHEIGNPLAIISGKTKLLLAAIRQGRAPERLAADLEKIERHADRIGRIAASLLTFSRRSTRERAGLRVEDALREAVGFMEHRLDAGKVRLSMRVAPDLPQVVACRAEIVQVFVNLLQNAFDAMPEGGVLRVEATAEDGTVRVVVADEGGGMTEAVRRRAFDPFFTTKDPGRGTGLGLSISHRIVRDHGGEISVESSPGRGSEFSIRLPAAEAAQDA